MAGNRHYALGRLKAGAMNKTEAAYAAHLEWLKQAGDVVWFRFEGVKLRLADSTFYTPDFAVMAVDGVLEMHEVKGFWEDDARVKVKVAADWCYRCRSCGDWHCTRQPKSAQDRIRHLVAKREPGPWV